MNNVLSTNFYLRPFPLIAPQADLFQPFSITNIVNNLRTRTYKSGYHALDRSNPRWGAIRDEALSAALQRTSSSALSSMTTERPTERPSIFFDNVKVVPNDYPGELALDQIDEAGAAAFIFLYNKIIKNQSPFTFAAGSTSDFKDFISANIQMLMTRPSGRLLIAAAYNAKTTICFKNTPHGSSAVYDLNQNLATIEIHNPSIPLTPGFTISENQQLDPLPAADWVVLGHELIHVLAELSVLSKLWALQDSNPDEIQSYANLSVPSTDPAYDNLSEVLAIEGVESLPSENMLNFEFGLAPRYGHLGYRTHELPTLPGRGIGFNPKAVNEILFTALTSDKPVSLAFIFPFLTPFQVVLAFHHSLPNKNPRILAFLETTLGTMDVNKLLEAIGLAASNDSYKITLSHLLTKHPEYINHLNPNTGCAPLHVAAFYNCYQTARMLLETKNADAKMLSHADWVPLDFALAATRNTSKLVSYFVERDPDFATLFFRTYNELPGHTKTFFLAQDLRAQARALMPSPQPVRSP